MDDVKLGLMSAVLNFLRGEFRAGYLDPENAEGLEVAIHCLENIYDVSNINRPGQQVPSLLDIYKSYLLSSVSCLRDATEQEKAEGERLKVEGNVAMSSGKFTEALEYYSRAIECNPKNAVYYCNRAAAKSKLNNHQSAIEDCKIAIELDPKYSKAYGRLGLAYCGLESYVSALENYKKAYELEPDNEGYQRNFELAQQKVAELCCCKMDDHNQSTSSAPNSSLNSSPNPSNITAEALNQLGAGADLNLLLTNPHLINIAGQMLADPAMQNMMSSIIHQDSGNGIQALLQVGQHLARQLQTENPNFLNQLRQSMPPNANAPPGGSNPDGQDGGESSHEKQQ